MKFIDRIDVDLPNKSAEAHFFVAANYLAEPFPNKTMLLETVMLEIAVTSGGDLAHGKSGKFHVCKF